MALGPQIRRLGRHSVIYGLGGIVSRLLAVFLLPLYTRYLDRADFGAVGMIVAMTAVLVTVLRLGISSAFFRFYFDSQEPAQRRLVVRTSFWFTMASATLGLVAGVVLARPLADVLGVDDANLVRAGFVAVWAQMNYEQLTALFRVEERSTAYVLASLANIAVTVGATVLLVVALEKGAIGVIVGSFTGTLVVYLALLAVHREQLGLAVLAAAAAGDEPLRDPARPGRARADPGQLQRSLLPRPPRRARGGRALRDRRAHRVGDGAPADRVPARVAGVRVLDRGRRRGQADLLVRPHLPRR